jgi:hypothetical protein
VNCQSQVIREVLSPAQQKEADSLDVVIHVKLQGEWYGYFNDSTYFLHFYGDSIVQQVIKGGKYLGFGTDPNVSIVSSSVGGNLKLKVLIKSTFQLTGHGLIEYMVKGYNPDDTSVPGYYARSWGSAYFLNDTLRVSGAYITPEKTVSVNYKKLSEVR